MEKIDFNPKDLIDKFLKTGDERHLDLIKANIGNIAVANSISNDIVCCKERLSSEQKTKCIEAITPEIIKRIAELNIGDGSIALMIANVLCWNNQQLANAVTHEIIEKIESLDIKNTNIILLIINTSICISEEEIRTRLANTIVPKILLKIKQFDLKHYNTAWMIGRTINYVSFEQRQKLVNAITFKIMNETEQLDFGEENCVWIIERILINSEQKQAQKFADLAVLNMIKDPKNTVKDITNSYVRAGILQVLKFSSPQSSLQLSRALNPLIEETSDTQALKAEMKKIIDAEEERIRLLREASIARLKTLHTSIDTLGQQTDIAHGLTLDCSSLEINDTDFIELMVHLGQTAERVARTTAEVMIKERRFSVSGEEEKSDKGSSSRGVSLFGRRFNLKRSTEHSTQTSDSISTLGSLNLSGNRLNETVFDILNRILFEGNFRITELNLSNVDLSKINPVLLRNLIASGKISKVILNNCNLTRVHALAIADGLRKNPFIEEVSINNNTDICSEGLSAITEAMSTMPNLRVARLSNVGANVDKVLGKNVRLLSKLRNLEILDLSGNKISSSECLASIVKHNTTIQELNLSNCEICDKDLLNIVKSLEKQRNSGLRVLNLSGNGITKVGVQALTTFIERVKEEISIERLNLSGNKIDEQSALKLYTIMLINSKIKEVILDGNSEISQATLEKINQRSREKLEEQKKQEIERKKQEAERKKKEVQEEERRRQEAQEAEIRRQEAIRKEQELFAVPSAPLLPISEILQDTTSQQHTSYTSIDTDVHRLYPVLPQTTEEGLPPPPPYSPKKDEGKGR